VIHDIPELLLRFLEVSRRNINASQGISSNIRLGGVPVVRSLKVLFQMPYRGFILVDAAIELTEG
jgi:hypothetical protein